MMDFDPEMARPFGEIARHEREGLYKGGPSVSFAYARDLHEEHCPLWSKKMFGLKITRCEEMTDEIAFWLAMERALKEAAAVPEKELAQGLKDQFRYSIRFIVPVSDTQQSMLQSFLYVSAGMGPDFTKGNCDTVDAMHEIDRIGGSVLECGLSHGRKPVWASADYNFCGIDPTRSGLPMEELNRLLERYARRDERVADAVGPEDSLRAT
jgi:hypothetical protein